MINDSTTGLWLDGAFQEAHGDTCDLVDPSSGEAYGILREATGADVDRAVAGASAARRSAWAQWTPAARGDMCLGVAQVIRANAEAIITTIVRDTGLPRWLAEGDVATSARYFEYYGGMADKLGGRTIPLGPGAVDFTVLEPWGVCAVILPFNVPLQMASRSVAAALITGNTVVLKAADQAPVAQMWLPALVAAAGAPSDVVTAVAGPGPTVGHALVQHAMVDHVTFTGSLGVGRQILSDAAHTVKPTLLELGGKSPHIVLADGDLDAAVPAIVASALRTSGQVCSAGSRVLVHHELHDELLARLGDEADRLTVGSASSNPDVGPVVSGLQRDRIVEAVSHAMSDGAEKVTRRPPRPTDLGNGFFVNPTVLSARDHRNSAASTEIFGPVVAVTPISGAEEARDVLGSSDVGLVAGVWTSDIREAHRLARDIPAGQVFINSYGVGGGVELPFGGYRRSGFGRLKGIDGAVAYTQTKNVCIAI